MLENNIFVYICQYIFMYIVDIFIWPFICFIQIFKIYLFIHVIESCGNSYCCYYCLILLPPFYSTSNYHCYYLFLYYDHNFNYYFFFVYTNNPMSIATTNHSCDSNCPTTATTAATPNINNGNPGFGPILPS